MIYSIRHLSRFRYSNPISESMMELRMQPRNEGNQRCLSFDLSIGPRAKFLSYRDFAGNTVHHFDISGSHSQLAVTSQALVELNHAHSLPESLSSQAWNDLDALVKTSNQWEMLMSSPFVRTTDPLRKFAEEIDLRRRDDPLTVVKQIMRSIYEAFDYTPKSTRVDSPIDEALQGRRGVCQDFAHIMIGLARELGIPCRYVSGYLYHHSESHDRSSEGATHAWVEALLPGLGWTGFDPTNNLPAAERHIRVAIGRDYSDVPPTRGVFRGTAESELSVAVRVATSEARFPEEMIPATVTWSTPISEDQSQQQQQQ
jgi:transglutaminase-like putative cysteine protease